jgi:predicted aldo/keto reductase-like oxidoreductase
MEYRQLGGSGLRVPALSFGTATFGGGNEFFKAWGSTQVGEATRLVDLCLDAGVNLLIQQTSIPPDYQNKYLAKRSKENAINF